MKSSTSTVLVAAIVFALGVTLSLCLTEAATATADDCCLVSCGPYCIGGAPGRMVKDVHGDWWCTPVGSSHPCWSEIDYCACP